MKAEMSTLDSEERSLRVVLRVEPGPDCPLVLFENTPENVKTQLSDGHCLCEAVLSPKETIEHVSRDLESDCVCSVFHEEGCVVDIEEVDGEKLTVTTHVCSRAELSSLVEGLESIVESIELLELRSVEETDFGNDEQRIDLSSLTEKQRVAAELAMERGYYERPRKTSLKKMAGELDISQQALSQRLCAVEEKLMTQIFDRTV